MNQEQLLSAHGVSKRYSAAKLPFARDRHVLAVDDVSFAVHRGEIFAIIGESGSGKSTLTRLLVGLEAPTSGYVEFRGQRLDRDLKHLRRQVQVVFQDPYSSLDPRLTIGATIREPLLALKVEGDLSARVREVLDAVALPSGAERKYPHEFSAGQLQRIAIARALAPGPDAIVADEPVSALDVSVQAQVLNLLLDLRDQTGLTIVLVAHDLGVVSRVADRVAVMFAGKLLEVGETHEIVSHPRHPYTNQLLQSVLGMDGTLPDEDPPQGDEPVGTSGDGLCPYRSRCTIRVARCDEVPVLLRHVDEAQAADDNERSDDAEGGHLVACHVMTR